MNKSIPAGAAILLSFIYATETGRSAPECYDVIFANRQTALTKPITAMTIKEVMAGQNTWNKAAWAKKFNSTKASSAAGAGQFMVFTLESLIKSLNLSDDTLFNSDTQDLLAYALLKRRGYLEFMAGKISCTEFGKRLSQEWASFPVLSPTQGSSRKLARGQSYYAGDGLNKALVKPETVERILDDVRAAGNKIDPVLNDSVIINTKPSIVTLDEVKSIAVSEPTSIVVDAVKPIHVPEVDLIRTPVPAATIYGGLLLAAGSALVAGWSWIASLPCSLIGLACGN